MNKRSNVKKKNKNKNLKSKISIVIYSLDIINKIMV
jgi:hypothetical protein